MKVRAVALLFMAVLMTTAEQRDTAPETLYAEARLAFDRGEIEHALALGKAGRQRFAGQARWQELFTMVIVDSLARYRREQAITELRLAPRSGDPEATIRRLMTEGYLRVDDTPFTKADALAARWLPSLRPEIAVRRAAPPMQNDDGDGMERFARQAMAGTKPTEQPFVYANARIMLASADMKRHDYQKSIEQMRWAEAFAQTVGAKGAAGIAAGNRGYTYYLLGDTQEALAGFNAALQAARELGNAATEISWLANIASVYLAEERLDQALQYARESLVVAERFGEKRRLALALSNLAQVEIELGRYADARQHIDRALALQPYVTSARERHFMLLNRARIDGATGSPDAAFTILDTLARPENDDPVLRWNAEAVMAHVYRQQGKLADAERMYAAALDTADDARDENRSDIPYLFAFEANLIRFYDEWIGLLLENQRTEDALLVAERSRARTLRSRADDPLPPPKSLARLHDATILCYWITPRRSLAWVVTGDDISVVGLPQKSVLSKETAEYRNEVVRGYSTADSPRGARLFKMLVAPIPVKARKGRVVIIADGPLTGITFESLIVPEPSPRYWIEDVTVSYAPSLHFLATAASPRSLRGARALLVGDVPDQGSAFPRLAQAGAEIDMVARHFRNSLPLKGNDATLSRYRSSRPQDFSVIHFATHSTASVHSPLESSVILAQGSRLTGHEITQQPLHANLVTLSSCNSSGIRAYPGEGLVGLAWAFLNAHAQHVVAAQWEVNDQSTRKIMDQMYGALSDGRDPATALRAAKLNLMHSDRRFASPFFWAPFILYGAP